MVKPGERRLMFGSGEEARGAGTGQHPKQSIHHTTSRLSGLGRAHLSGSSALHRTYKKWCECECEWARR